MTQLYINGREAVLKSGTSFKFTRENPLFTDAGDYTFEVQLPLNGCRTNQLLFGPLHRAEVPLVPEVGQRYPFRLLALPLSVDGKCVVTSVTQDEVKVQLLARNSQLNLDETDAEGEDLYIDEQELGKAYENEMPTAYAGDPRVWDNGSKVMTSFRHSLIMSVLTTNNEKWMYGQIDETDCVNFPVWSTADSAMANDRMLHDTEETGKDGGGRTYNYALKKPSEPLMDEVHVFAAQPYLVVILERVLQALGYKVRTNVIRGTWMEDIFIANARSEYEFRKVLPHWTVKEFMTEVQNFFGVFLTVEGTEVDIVRRSDYYSSSLHRSELRMVSDERSADLDTDEDSGKDATAANVDYDHRDSDDMLRLPDEVWENAIVKTFTSKAELDAWAESATDDDKKSSSAWLLVDESTGRTYAYLCSKKNQRFSLAQVDCCPPLIRGGKQWSADGRDIGVKLRIVPAKMQMVPIVYRKTTMEGGRYGKEELVENVLQVPMLSTSDSRKHQRNAYSVNAAINPDGDSTDSNATDEKPDTIEVAYNPCTPWHYVRAESETRGPSEADIPSPLGIAYVKDDDGFYEPIVQEGNRDQFRLTNRDDPSLNASSLSLSYSIDTRCEHLFSFADRGIPSVGDVFLIRGKRYACHKLEFTIDEHGIRPLKQGYFYEIN